MHLRYHIICDIVLQSNMLAGCQIVVSVKGIMAELICKAILIYRSFILRILPLSTTITLIMALYKHFSIL